MAELHVAFDPEKHIYTLNGKRVTNVTSILADANMLEGIEFMDESCRTRGQAVHNALEFAADDDLDESSLHQSIRPYIEAAQEFDANSGFRTLISEPLGIHPLYLYGFKIDRVGLYMGRLTVLDFKSGHMNKNYTALQTAGYAAGLPYIREFEKIKHLYDPKKVQRMGVELRANGTYDPKFFRNREDWPDFLACLRVHNRKQHKGGYHG